MDQDFNKEYQEAVARGAHREPHLIKRVIYIPNGLVDMKFRSGVHVTVPVAMIRELKYLPEEQLIELAGNGEHIRVESADIDINPIGLIADVLLENPILRQAIEWRLSNRKYSQEDL